MQLVHETAAEILKAVRAPEYILPTLLFPLPTLTIKRSIY